MTSAELHRRQAIPARHVVMGYRLRPFTVGHAVLFDVLGLADSIATGPEVALAAKLCTMSSAKAKAWLEGPFLGARLWWIGKTRAAWMDTPKGVQECVDAFRAYLDEWSRMPSYVFKGDGDGGDMGTPFPQHLRVILLNRLNYRPDEVDDVPLSRALWDYAAIMEADGHITVRQDVEDDVERELFRQADELGKRMEKEKAAC